MPEQVAPKKTSKGTPLTVVYALTARGLLMLEILFIGSVSIKNTEFNAYYVFWAVPIAGFIGEGVYRIYKKQGQEDKWFSPCMLLYLASAVPGAWVLEIDRLQVFQRLNTTEAGRVELDGVTEQTLMFLPVLCRWILPRGKMSRYQLSKLLYMFISMASDMMEIFFLFDEENQVHVSPNDTSSFSCSKCTFIPNDTSYFSCGRCAFTPNDTSCFSCSRSTFTPNDTSCFSCSRCTFTPNDTSYFSCGRCTFTPNVRRDPGLTFVILFIWSISLFQLAINLTATKSITLNDKRYDFCSAVKRTEIWGLLVTFFLQDGPFLVVRLYALICYETYTYTIIFFTCKNMLNASLCIYRFIILVGQVRNQK
ncbi:hypothetical protein BaRGS_00015383 [Batillaria attramentaria]|uniref:Uncharacterized protein n=1 Tax=Batillaria attramentaria TaxID=370345 RepID=A0ABD0L2G2_9CAEN